METRGAPSRMNTLELGLSMSATVPLIVMDTVTSWLSSLPSDTTNEKVVYGAPLAFGGGTYVTLPSATAAAAVIRSPADVYRCPRVGKVRSTYEVESSSASLGAASVSLTWSTSFSAMVRSREGVTAGASLTSVTSIVTMAGAESAAVAPTSEATYEKVAYFAPFSWAPGAK